MSLLLLLLTFPDPPAEQPELALLSQTLHRIAVDRAPRVFEDLADWNKSTPLEPGLSLLGLRTRVKVGDREELAHGSWSRSKIALGDVAKDTKVTVRELKPLPGGKQRIVLEIDARFAWEHERKVWLKGLPIAGLSAGGNCRGVATITCEFSSTLDTSVFPPTLKVDAVVKENKLELRELEVTKLPNIPLVGEQAKKLVAEIRPVLQVLLTYKEKDLTPVLNEVLAEALRKK